MKNSAAPGFLGPRGWSADGTSPADYRYLEPVARVAMRMTVEYLIGVAEAVNRRFDGNFELGIYFLCILRAERRIDDQPGPIERRLAPATPRGISINALAVSFGRPFETVRRQVNRLIAMGCCERFPTGVAVTATALSDPATETLMLEIHDMLIRLIEDLRSIGFPLPATSDSPAPLPTRIVQIGIELILTSIDINARPHSKWADMLIFAAVLAANYGGVSHAAALENFRHKPGAPVPESERAPVTVRRLAKTLHMAYPTLRRHVGDLLKAGWLTRKPGGLVTHLDVFQRPDMLALTDAQAQRLATALGELAHAGFPFDATPLPYRQGRAPILTFGQAAIPGRSPQP